MSDLVPVKRALLSVSDKTGLTDFARALQTEFNIELISTGGTAKSLRDAGLVVTDVSDLTGFPEMMDGRVKTLHPKIHGGLLAVRDNPDHLASAQSHDIPFIDLVCINLYPFAQTIAKPNTTFHDAIENIDIGGPAMVRSASKNHAFVTVVTSPNQYEKVLGDLRQHHGSTCSKHRLKLAQKAFDHTATYDRTIADYLSQQLTPHDTTTLPSSLPLHLHKKQDLRYGENPHQRGALYIDTKAPYVNAGPPSEASIAHAIQHHGKELSYINLLDADAAMAAVKEFPDAVAACVVKHATPCGLAAGTELLEVFNKAYAGDPVAAFGGIVAVNRIVDDATAQAMTEGKKFLEVVVAPGYTPDALEMLKTRWKNVRLLEVHGEWRQNSQELMLHKITGGYLVQDRDTTALNESDWKVVSTRQPTDSELADLRLAWIAAKHVKSNAITIAKDSMLLGSGAGQQDRLSSCRIAVTKAGDRANGAVAASDAFFPFPDGPQILLDAGVTAIIHPGGSLRDNETTDLINSRNACLILTGQRHFKH